VSCTNVIAAQWLRLSAELFIVWFSSKPDHGLPSWGFKFKDFPPMMATKASTFKQLRKQNMCDTEKYAVLNIYSRKIKILSLKISK